MPILYLALAYLALVILVPSSCLQSDQDAFGYVNEGPISGKTMTTRNGRTISAFLGIPYAKPPVGSLRFEPPQPAENRGNVTLRVTTDANRCPQLNDDGAVVGNEDCLYLNVYTTTLSDRLPTMVYFHGGNFVRGSGSSGDAGPQYLMDRDVVLVTVNYRLGVLGFLSTGDAAAPGNFGLKDQVLALRWIRDNIANLGGDPGRVTIFGQGAGAVSTSLHAMSDASDGLFHRYISQSGNALCFWAVAERVDDYKHYATILGNHVNCPTDDSQILVDCLRGVDVESLVDSDEILESKYWRFATWRPTIEKKEISGAFLDAFPRDKVAAGKLKDVPAIFGNVADEGLIMTAQFPKDDNLYDRITSDPFAYVLHMAKTVNGPHDVENYARDLDDFFFNGTEPSDKEKFTKKMTRFISSVAFDKPLHDFMHNYINYGHPKSPFYQYSFDYRGTFSHTSLTMGSNENIGVTHADDLLYIFPPSPKFNDSFPGLRLSENDERMIDTMIDLWTSFASNRAPTTNSTSGNFSWKAYNEKTLSYLKIGNDSDPTLSSQQQLNPKHIENWTIEKVKPKF